MTKAVDHFHDRIFKMINNKNINIEPPSAEDLMSTITTDRQLWSEFRFELKRNNIVTNVAIKEYLFVFMMERREVIEKRHLLSKELEDESQRTKVNAEKDKNASGYLGAVKNTMRSSGSFSNLWAMVLQNCESEVNWKQRTFETKS